MILLDIIVGATVKDGLPIPKPTGDFIIRKADKVGIYGHYYHYQTVCIMLQEYSDQQNAELLAKISQLEESYTKFAKERDEQYGEYIDLNVGLRNENAEFRKKVSKLETENKDYYLRVKELEFVGQVDNDCIESQSNEIDELKAWKESAMAEAEKLDIQSIGVEIGCTLGSSIPEQVLPCIREQKAKIASYESAIDGLKKVVDSLYNLRS